MIWLFSLSFLVGLAASIEDLWHRRVSNVLTMGGFVAGVGAHAFLGGWSGALDSLLGGLIGFGVFFVFYLLGGMGGGDIKLMAAFGAIVGSGQVVLAALLTAMAGGLMGIVYLAYKKLRRIIDRKADGSVKADRKEFIPYAPAISLGVLLSFLSVVPE